MAVTFAEDIARALGETPGLGGVFGRLTGGARNVEFLGERALLVMNRIPRLAQWHAEAAAAGLLEQPEISESLAALKDLGELKRTLPEQLATLLVLDARLAALPDKLAVSLAKQPELKEVLVQLQQIGQELKALESGVLALGCAVTNLDLQMSGLVQGVHADTLRQHALYTTSLAWTTGRSLLLLGTGCVAALLLLHALLKRWLTKTVPRV